MPTVHWLPSGNWPLALAEALEQVREGDTIVVHTPAMQALAEAAAAQMCPHTHVRFCLGAPVAATPGPGGAHG
jgi:hypothetical protein